MHLNNLDQICLNAMFSFPFLNLIRTKNCTEMIIYYWTISGSIKWFYKKKNQMVLFLNVDLNAIYEW